MSKDKNLTEFTIDDLVVNIYNEIAKWHNEDTTAPGLKQLTFNVINEVTSSVFKHLDIPYNGEIKLDQEAKEAAIKKMAEAKK